MIIRQITLSTTPAQQINLFFDSRSNAEKNPEPDAHGGGKQRAIFTDDYKQMLTVDLSMVAADIIIDVGEQARANGELQIGEMLAEMKFGERIEKDAVLKTHMNKKRAAQIAANAPRVPMPPGLQT